MKKFVVVERAEKAETRNIHPILSSIWGINKLITPFVKDEYILKDALGSLVKIPAGIENFKLSYLMNMIGKKHIILSKDYNINFDNDFYISCIVRALDIFSLRMGSDLRTNEVLIADADNELGKIIFYFILPLARRIILLTKNKETLMGEVDYAFRKFGTSVAVLEDIIKAEKLANTLIITDSKYEFLLKTKKPTLTLCKINIGADNCFGDVEITLNFSDFFQPIFALGYLSINNYKKLWSIAEEQGFRIARFRLDKKTVFEL